MGSIKSPLEVRDRSAPFVANETAAQGSVLACVDPFSKLTGKGLAVLY